MHTRVDIALRFTVYNIIYDNLSQSLQSADTTNLSVHYLINALL